MRELRDWWWRRRGWTVFRCPECKLRIAWKGGSSLVYARMHEYIQKHCHDDGVM